MFGGLVSRMAVLVFLHALGWSKRLRWASSESGLKDSQEQQWGGRLAVNVRFASFPYGKFKRWRNGPAYGQEALQRPADTRMEIL